MYLYGFILFVFSNSASAIHARHFLPLDKEVYEVLQAIGTVYTLVAMSYE